jgi:nitroreductase
MELMEAIRDRRSIRKFLPDPVAEEDLAEIVAAGTLAPNAENDQMWRFVAVTNKQLIAKIGEVVSLRVDSMIKACETLGYDGLAHHKYFLVFFQNAPAIITAFTRPSVNAVDKALAVLGMEFKTSVPVDAVQQSIGAAIQNMSLVAHAKGYGTTWMFGPVLAHHEIAQLLGVPEPWMLSALLPIGKPSQHPRPRPRKPLDEVFTIIK